MIDFGAKMAIILLNLLSDIFGGNKFACAYMKYFKEIQV